MNPTEDRLRLLANGYAPLPLSGKRCLLDGWPRAAVSAAMVQRWASLPWANATGLRIERGLIAVDIDFNDAALTDALAERLPQALWDRIGAGMGVRTSGAPGRELWLLRRRGRARVEDCASVAAMVDGATARVEIFTGSATRQVGALGWHTPETRRYEWAQRSPLDVRMHDLPEVTQADLDAIVAAADSLLKERGTLIVEQPDSGSVQRTLPLGHVYQTERFGLVDLAALADLAYDHEQVRLSASWLEGPSAVNTTRCIAYSGASGLPGDVRVYETASGTLYLPDNAEIDAEIARQRAPETDAVEQLAAALNPGQNQNAPEAQLLPTILLTDDGDLPGQVDTIGAVLAATGQFYRQGGQVVAVDGAGSVTALPDPALGLAVARHVTLTARKRGRTVRVNPPAQLVATLSAAADGWAPPLRAVVTAPLAVWRDGRAQPLTGATGYDAGSRLYFASPMHDVPAVTEQGVPDAVAVLLAPFEEFPAASRGALLAAILTAVCRPGLDTAPLLCIDAPSPGSGKTLLATCLAALAGSGPQAVQGLQSGGRDDAEVEKRLLALGRSGASCAVYDNLTGVINAPPLAAYITSPQYTGRPLGTSMMATVDTAQLLVVTGNNLTLGPDLARRAVVIRLDSGLERPTARAFRGRPLDFVIANRASLCRLATGLLCGEWRTRVGAPRSFAAWDHLIGAAVEEIHERWPSLELGDPYAPTREAENDADGTAEVLALLTVLHERFGSGRFTAADVYQRATLQGDPMLRDALEGLAPTLSIKGIGRALRWRRDVVAGGLVLRQSVKSGAPSGWRILPASGAEVVPLHG